MTNQATNIRFFKEIFLVTNINLDIDLKIFFLTSNGANVDFQKKELWWRSYTIKKVFFSTIKQVKLVNKKKFTAIFFNPRHDIFVVYITFFDNPNNDQNDDINLFYKAKISGFVANKISILIFVKYFNFVDIFFLKLASKLFQHIGINDYTIKQISKQLSFYEPIYSLKLVELKTLKISIKTNLVNNFIRPFKFLANAPIFYDKKLNISF